ncbi:MAG TPA: methyltransferase domain-containing protein [Actinocatenispora sp.]
MPEYVFDNAGEETVDRFAALEGLYDKVTVARLGELGVGPGWQCLEVGGGGGSLARWLAGAVGPTGSVLATDIDPSRMDCAVPGVTVRQHDIVTDPLPDNTFDLVHARLVLLHLPGRQRALERILAALKPGGLLVLDEFDCSYLPLLAAPDDRARALFAAVSGGIHRLIDDIGGDSCWGRNALGAMRDAGFADCASSAYCESWPGGSPGARLHRANAVQVRDQLVGKGIVSDDDFAAFLTLIEDPALVMNSYLMHTVHGRRPA